MPIYENQCGECRRDYRYLVRQVAHHQAPACPQCGGVRMTRVLSRFAAPKGGTQAFGESAGPNGGAPSNHEDMPPGMENLMAEAAGMDENDPRAMGRFMRKMAEQTGEPVPPEMHEAIRRLESGEDPDKIEEQMGDAFGDKGGGPPAGGDDDLLYDG